MTPPFSPEGIRVILEACEATGVSELRLGELHVRFGSHTEPTQDAASLHPAKATAEPNHDQINQETLERDELLLREAQIEELLITDPLRAEELMNQGELKDYGDDQA